MNYETVLIVDGVLDEATIDAEIKTAEDFIAKNGELLETDKWGKRRLAYPIQKKTSAHYTLLKFKGDGKLVIDMEHSFRYNKNVLRYLTVALDN